MKPPLRQVNRNSPLRKGIVRRPGNSNVMLRGSGVDSTNALAEVQSSNIRVAVRVRPLNSRESSSNNTR